MQQERRDQIDRLASALRRELDLATPLDVDLLVSRLGGKIEELPADAPAEAQIRREGTSFVIGLRRASSQERRRFSVAHELGHLFLHMNFLDEERWNGVSEPFIDSPFFRAGHSEEEYEAHEFAAALLMPAPEFRQVAARHLEGKVFDIEPIAAHFKVSIAAARTRGRWLGLFSWN